MRNFELDLIKLQNSLAETRKLISKEGLVFEKNIIKYFKPLNFKPVISSQLKNKGDKNMIVS